MMKTNVIVTLKVPGLHAWPGVKDTPYNDKVGYLATIHRHMFWFKAEKNVSHADRDIEIIDLRNQIQRFLEEKYWNENTGCLEFGAMSCEMIAEELLKEFVLDSCEVLEDGENGAIIEKQVEWSPPPSDGILRGPISSIPTNTLIRENIETEVMVGTKVTMNPDVMSGKNMTFVCSYLCSGKSTLSKGIVQLMVENGIYKHHEIGFIEVSDIVREILQKQERGDLQGHPELSDSIIHRIATLGLKYKHLVVSGVRQVSILNQFRKASMIWLDVPEYLRFERYQFSEKDHDKTQQGFAAANMKDVELGLQDVKQFIFNRQLLKR